MEPRLDISEALKQIPRRLRGELSIGLTDLLLVSKKGDKMPATSAKELLHLWHDDKLGTDTGLKLLLETALYVDPEETRSFLILKGLQSLTKSLGTEGQK